jgi:hypothetical protein
MQSMSFAKAKPSNFVFMSGRLTSWKWVAGALLGALCRLTAVAQGEGEGLTGFDAVYGEGIDVVLSDAGRFHVTAHSQGAGLGFQRTKFDGAFGQRGWQVEFVFVRHPKEEKTRNPFYEESLPYVYGKVNAHHALRAERVRATTLTEKYRKDGVTVMRYRHWGAVLGISKPIYLEILYPEIPYTSLEVEVYNPEIHFIDRIYGRAPWVNGLESLEVTPGLGWGEGMSFEFNDQRTTTRTLDVGLHLDAYLNPVEILASEFVPSSRLHLTFVLRYAWGAQWSAKGLSESIR